MVKELDLLPFMLSIIGFFIGLACGGIVYKSKLKLEENKTWPSVKGKIEQLKPSIAGWEEVTIYSTNIVYSYEFQGSTYKGKVIRLRGKETEADEMKYPKGRIVNVYINPKKQFLKQEDPLIPKICFFLAVLFLDSS